MQGARMRSNERTSQLSCGSDGSSSRSEVSTKRASLAATRSPCAG